MFVVDRFEGEYALIEYRKRIFHIPKSLIPKGVKEGDVINIKVTADEEGGRKRKEAAGKPAGGVFKD